MIDIFMPKQKNGEKATGRGGHKLSQERFEKVYLHQIRVTDADLLDSYKARSKLAFLIKKYQTGNATTRAKVMKSMNFALARIYTMLRSNKYKGKEAVLKRNYGLFRDTRAELSQRTRSLSMTPFSSRIFG